MGFTGVGCVVVMGFSCCTRSVLLIIIVYVLCIGLFKNCSLIFIRITVSLRLLKNAESIIVWGFFAFFLYAV